MRRRSQRRPSIHSDFSTFVSGKLQAQETHQADSHQHKHKDGRDMASYSQHISWEEDGDEESGSRNDCHRIRSLSSVSWAWSWKRFWIMSGPGWLMSIAYVDPGNLIANVQSGAVAGYKLGWLLLLATFLGGILQIVAATTANVSGKSLAQLCRQHYPRWAYLSLWVMCELAIIGSDIQEVIGSALALKLLFGIPLYLGVIITAFDTFMVLLVHFFGMRKLEAVFGFLILVMSVCFVVEFIISSPPAIEVAKGIFIPSVPEPAVEQAVAMFGAVVMPANLYLHSALVLSREVDRKDNAKVVESNAYFATESIIALIVSFVINESIMAVFANGFYIDGQPQMDIGLQRAGDLLKVKYGRVAEVVWGIGLLAAGQSSTMAGTLTGQYVMEGFLQLQISPWLRALITRAVAIVPSIIVALMFTSNLDSLDEWLNVFQSLQLPFALLPLLTFCGQEKLLGTFRLGYKMQAFIGLVFIGVMAGNIYLVKEFVLEIGSSLSGMSLIVGTLGAALYLLFIAYLASNVVMSRLRDRKDRSSLDQPLLSSNADDDEVLYHASTYEDNSRS